MAITSETVCDCLLRKYSRGRRGAPAKGVGRVNRRESSNLSFREKEKASNRVPFIFLFDRRDLKGQERSERNSPGDCFDARVGSLTTSCRANLSFREKEKQPNRVVFLFMPFLEKKDSNGCVLKKCPVDTFSAP